MSGVKTDWSAERLDALPEGTVIAWEDFGITVHAAAKDGSWWVVGGDWIRDWQSILGWADPGSIRVVSVPIEALLAVDMTEDSTGLLMLESEQDEFRANLSAAIAHITGEAS